LQQTGLGLQQTGFGLQQAGGAGLQHRGAGLQHFGAGLQHFFLGLQQPLSWRNRSNNPASAFAPNPESTSAIPVRTAIFANFRLIVILHRVGKSRDAWKVEEPVPPHRGLSKNKNRTKQSSYISTNKQDAYSALDIESKVTSDIVQLKGHS